MVNFTSPLRFIPFLRPLVWGGRNLAAQLNKTLPTPENYGESWEISDHPLHASVVASGPFAGQTLHSLIEQHPQDIIGSASDESPVSPCHPVTLSPCHVTFPWLIKYLDARDWLSVQVHPDDALARRLRPGELGKTEAWFVLAVEPGSRIYAGLKPGVGPDEFRRAVAEGTVANLLHSFAPTAGDCLFLPAGTVHAVGGGVVMAEVQQNSDVTFRLFDWNRVDSQGRGRQLHVEEGLAAVDWSRGPVVPLNVPVPGDNDIMLSLVRCAYFDLSFVRRHRPAPIGGQGTLQALIVLAGQARMGNETIRRGDVWLLPACLPETTLEPEPFLAGLVCGMPSPS